VPLDHPSPTGPVLSFEAVHVRTDDGVELLRGVDLVVGHGEVVVLAGPSGAGKSTLLRLGNRLEVPSSGVVRFHGDDTAALDPRELRRKVGMVFQRPVVFAGTVRQNLAVADSTADDARLVGELERAGLDGEVLDRRADDLSGGEAQRMCVARALLTAPEVLLMDEPTSALDPANRRGIEALAGELARSGLGILWVTHDLAQARRLGEQVVVIVDGRNATPEETARYLDGDEDDDGDGDGPNEDSGPGAAPGTSPGRDPQEDR
jgi:putative ABC transport system ATP-binding protein